MADKAIRVIQNDDGSTTIREEDVPDPPTPGCIHAISGAITGGLIAGPIGLVVGLFAGMAAGDKKYEEDMAEYKKKWG